MKAAVVGERRALPAQPRALCYSLADFRRGSMAQQTWNTKCRRCGKGIIWPTLCYTCATGRPREIMRPDELIGETIPPIEHQAQSAAN